MLSCAETRELLEPLLDGDLDGRRETLLRLHLRGCRPCTSEHDEAASLPHRLRALRMPEPPARLFEDVIEAAVPCSPLLRWGLLPNC